MEGPRPHPHRSDSASPRGRVKTCQGHHSLGETCFMSLRQLRSLWTHRHVVVGALRPPPSFSQPAGSWTQTVQNHPEGPPLVETRTTRGPSHSKRQWSSYTSLKLGTLQLGISPDSSPRHTPRVGTKQGPGLRITLLVPDTGLGSPGSTPSPRLCEPPPQASPPELSFPNALFPPPCSGSSPHSPHLQTTGNQSCHRPTWGFYVSEKTAPPSSRHFSSSSWKIVTNTDSVRTRSC